MPIYHIAYPVDWTEATSKGEYRISTRGRTLEEQGFIHAGDIQQVAPVANLIYGEDDELIVLVIDPERLSSELRYEEVNGWADPFPHIFGPLNVDAVTHTVPLPRGEDGKYKFTDEDAASA
jgi:glutathione S-transferase